jgi:hypothetical protein
VQSLLAQASRELRGRVAGALRVSMRADAPLESTGRGRLSGEALDLEGLTSLPLRVERVDIEADGPAWRVHDLAVDWAGQKATARGVLAWQGAGPVINAEIQSPGIVLDAFLPPKEKRREEPALKSVSRQLASPPLKVTGNVLLRAGYVAFRRMRVQPLQATLELRPEGGALRLEQASVCGIAFPLQANFGAAGIEARVKLTAKNASLEETSRCLGDKNLSITGQFDLAADLGVKSKWDGIVAALEGPLELHAENGEIRKFAMLGNILALKNVRDAMKQDLRLDAEGFRYRDIDVKARFGRGKLAIEDAWLDSNAIGLAAYGTLELDDLTARITALVAPFSRIDRFVRSVPLFGYVIGGTLTSIPVGVNGDIREPLVVPLGPVAVTKQLFGVFERAVKLPFKVVGDLTNEAPEDGSLQKR